MLLHKLVAQDWKKHFEAEVEALKSGKKEEVKPTETKPTEETKPAEASDEKK